MKSAEAPCPACGAPVEFVISSALVTVCEFCRSVVARGDRKLEDLGKVADLVQTASPLHLGMRGKYRGKPFELVGRVQFQHEAGGVWDEWYAAFSNRRWGWLAEAQGKFYLTFEKTVSRKSQSKLPPIDELEVGRRFTFERLGELTVAEIGRTQALGAEGELPFQLVPNAAHDYADLSGPDGKFVTFDYSETPPAVFVGKEVTLDEIGISKDAKGPDRQVRKVSSLQVNCPKCAGALELLAPDQTQRVCCQNCGAMLDADHGKLKYLSTLKRGKRSPVIPIGTVGALDGTEYTVIGFMRRSVTYEGQDYFWSEYLLYQPREGFRWLVHSDAHWSFVRPVAAGDVNEGALSAEYGGKTFKLFEHATATVRYVLGEFYWKVEVGEQTDNRDFIAPPDMLSIERSQAEAESNKGEINYSLSTYLPHEDVERGFGVEGLRRGWKVAPNQPSPVDKMVYGYWAIFAAALLILNLLCSSIVSKKVDQWLFVWALGIVSVIPIAAALYAHSVERSRWEDSDYSPYSYEE